MFLRGRGQLAIRKFAVMRHACEHAAETTMLEERQDNLIVGACMARSDERCRASGAAHVKLMAANWQRKIAAASAAATDTSSSVGKK